MVNAIDKFTDIDLLNNDFKKLLEARNRLKSFEERDKIFKSEFDIKVLMKMLYDQEIYIVKFREYASNNQSPDQILRLNTRGISEKPTKSKIDKKKLEREHTLDVSNKSLVSSQGERSKTNTSILKREKLVKSINEGKQFHY